MNDESLVKEIDNLHAECLIDLNGNDGTAPPDGELFHYTSISSFKSIVESGQLYLGDARYLNDPKEIWEAVNILGTAINELCDEEILGPTVDRNFISFLIWLKYYFINLYCFDADYSEQNKNFKDDIKRYGGREMELRSVPVTKETIFIFCLSEKTDHLRQWIPYAQDGRGISIGFQNKDSADIEKFFESFSYVKVSYRTRNKKIEFVKTFLKKFNSIRMKAISSGSINSALSHLITLVIIDIIACKDSSYEDENEWRFFHVLNEEKYSDKVQFLERDGIIKPYIILPLPKDMVSSVTIGPKAEQKLNEQSISAILKKFHIGAKIQTSKAPYR